MLVKFTVSGKTVYFEANNIDRIRQDGGTYISPYGLVDESIDDAARIINAGKNWFSVNAAKNGESSNGSGLTAQANMINLGVVLGAST